MNLEQAFDKWFESQRDSSGYLNIKDREGDQYVFEAGWRAGRVELLCELTDRLAEVLREVADRQAGPAAAGKRSGEGQA